MRDTGGERLAQPPALVPSSAGHGSRPKDLDLVPWLVVPIRSIVRQRAADGLVRGPASMVRGPWPLARGSRAVHLGTPE